MTRAKKISFGVFTTLLVTIAASLAIARGDRIAAYVEFSRGEFADRLSSSPHLIHSVGQDRLGEEVVETSYVRLRLPHGAYVITSDRYNTLERIVVGGDCHLRSITLLEPVAMSDVCQHVDQIQETHLYTLIPRYDDIDDLYTCYGFWRGVLYTERLSLRTLLIDYDREMFEGWKAMAQLKAYDPQFDSGSMIIASDNVVAIVRMGTASSAHSPHAIVWNGSKGVGMHLDYNENSMPDPNDVAQLISSVEILDSTDRGEVDP